MRKLLSLAAALASIAVAAATAHAQEAAQEADASAGAALYQSNCLSCHGPNGVSVLPTNPILAGQHEDYLRQQIAAYRDGTRQNPVMASMATGLSDGQITDLARYLSEQPPALVGAADMDSAAKAIALYRHGDKTRGIPACAACHSPTGAGIAGLAPRLSGQHPDSTLAAFNAYLTGDRPTAGMMLDITPKLTSEEMTHLAEYLAGLSH